MKKEFKNRQRTIHWLFIVAIPMFLMSISLIYDFQIKNITPQHNKAYIAYFTVFLAPILALSFYYVDKQLSKRRLVFDKNYLSFGAPNNSTHIAWQSIANIQVSSIDRLCIVNTNGSNNSLLSNGIIIKYCHYDITLDELWLALSSYSEQHKFEINEI